MFKLVLLLKLITFFFLQTDGNFDQRFIREIAKGRSFRYSRGKDGHHDFHRVRLFTFSHGHRGFHRSAINIYNHYKSNHYSCPRRPAKYSDINNLLNGQVEVWKPVPGNTAAFSCNTKYTLCGNDVITCNLSGQWDGSMPVCITEDIISAKNFTVGQGNSLYYFSTIKRSFNGSQKFCEGLGGNLVAINSREEQEFVSCVAYNMDKYIKREYRYIGLTINDKDEWEWSNGESLSFEYRLTELDGICMAMIASTGYLWTPGTNATACDYPRKFICEIN